MKKSLILIPAIAALTACSGMKSVDNRDTYAQPGWYQECAQHGTEGWFWNSKDYVYSCGAGESAYAQAAEEQMYAIALNGFAKRINGVVNSETKIGFVNDKKMTKTVISHSVTNTAIREHVQSESGRFTMGGRHYTFVRLKMPKSTFDQLIAEAKGQ